MLIYILTLLNVTIGNLGTKPLSVVWRHYEAVTATETGKKVAKCKVGTVALHQRFIFSSFC